MDTQFGKMVSGDFSKKTITFEIEEEMVMTSGKYAIIPIAEYNEVIDLVKGLDTSDPNLNIGCVRRSDSPLYEITLGGMVECVTVFKQSLFFSFCQAVIS
jgi:hypothetical protein